VPYDEERRVFLSDYFNRADQNITKDLLANPLGWSGETNSLLVNGFSAHLPMRRPHVLQQSSVLSQTKPTDSDSSEMLPHPLLRSLLRTTLTFPSLRPMADIPSHSQRHIFRLVPVKDSASC
jgi:hypothetical protein